MPRTTRWSERVRRGERVALVVATNDDADAISDAIQQRRLDTDELRADAAREELADAMRRGVPEPTIQDSRLAAQIDRSRAARRVVAPAAMDPVVRPAASRGLGL